MYNLSTTLFTKGDTMGIEEYLLERAKKQAIEKGREEGRIQGRKEGYEEVCEEKNITFVKSMLANTDFDDEKIAVIVGVTLSFVQEVKRQTSL